VRSKRVLLNPINLKRDLYHLKKPIKETHKRDLLATYALSLVLSLSRFLSRALTHTHTHTHTHTQTHTHTLSLSFFHMVRTGQLPERYIFLSRAHTQTNTRTLSPTHTLSFFRSLVFSYISYLTAASTLSADAPWPFADINSQMSALQWKYVYIKWSS